MNPLHVTWLLLLKIVLVLSVVYLIIKLIGRITPRFIKRVDMRNNFVSVYSKIHYFFIMLAAIYVVLTFVSINYIVHGGFVILFVVVLFPFIRSMLHGVTFQLNGLIHEGMGLNTGKYSGELIKFTPLGIVLSNVDGNRFINYLDLHKKGFTAVIKNERSSRSHLFIETELKNHLLIDLLFESPFINPLHMPTITSTDNPDVKTLYFTRADGGHEDDIITFLKQNNIKIITKN